MRTFCLWGAAVICGVARAQEAPQDPPAPESVVSGSLGIATTNQYFFRGILQENQGIIAQPWIELCWGLGGGPDGDDTTLTIGSWNSLHDGPTGSQFSTVWYESDFYVGLASKLSDRWSGSLTYIAMHAPNGNWGTVQELSVALSYDDSEIWGDALPGGLQPSAVIGFETSGSMETGPAGKEGTYLQLGLGPSFELGGFAGLAVTLSTPLTVGLSLGDYYEAPATGGDEAFGFFDVGIDLSAPLTFLPAGAGPWSASLGLHYVRLGDTNQLRNAGDANELIASFGVSTTF
ncbi:MAG: hypothetical protein KDE27_04785 [Planctomycetes bacterium]|nr:hypothetical protein [Planctomycetota bacterium]